MDFKPPFPQSFFSLGTYQTVFLVELNFIRRRRIPRTVFFLDRFATRHPLVVGRHLYMWKSHQFGQPLCDFFPLAIREQNTARSTSSLLFFRKLFQPTQPTHALTPFIPVYPNIT